MNPQEKKDTVTPKFEVTQLSNGTRPANDTPRALRDLLMTTAGEYEVLAARASRKASEATAGTRKVEGRAVARLVRIAR
jgi:hypothetical protein